MTVLGKNDPNGIISRFILPNSIYTVFYIAPEDVEGNFIDVNMYIAKLENLIPEMHNPTHIQFALSSIDGTNITKLAETPMISINGFLVSAPLTPSIPVVPNGKYGLTVQMTTLDPVTDQEIPYSDTNQPIIDVNMVDGLTFPTWNETRSTGGPNPTTFPWKPIPDVHNAYSTDARLFPIYANYIVLPQYALTINPSDNGYTDPLAGTHNRDENTYVTVTAYPNDGYLFDYWVYDDVNVGSSNPINVYMDNNHTLQAVYYLIQYTLTIESYPVQSPFTLV